MNATELYAQLGHWTWIVVGVVLAILEILLPGTFLIWFALAALVVGVLDWLFTLTFSLELILFAVISIPAVALACAGVCGALGHAGERGDASSVAGPGRAAVRAGRLVDTV